MKTIIVIIIIYISLLIGIRFLERLKGRNALIIVSIIILITGVYFQFFTDKSLPVYYAQSVFGILSSMVGLIMLLYGIFKKN